MVGRNAVRTEGESHFISLSSCVICIFVVLFCIILYYLNISFGNWCSLVTGGTRQPENLVTMSGWGRDLCIYHRVQPFSVVHPPSYGTVSGSSFSGVHPPSYGMVSGSSFYVFHPPSYGTGTGSSCYGVHPPSYGMGTGSSFLWGPSTLLRNGHWKLFLCDPSTLLWNGH
jgi:hypothetical protein